MWLPLLAVTICLFTAVGCSIFSPVAQPAPFSSANSVLSPIQAAPEAIQLEVFILERPAGEPLLTTGIWKEVDQIGSMSPETRNVLKENGFRVGNVSSNPPPSVQRLLGRTAEIQSASDEGAKPLIGYRRYVAPGVETEISTGIFRDQCDFIVREGDHTKSLEYQKVGCVLRMKANRLQEGWVRVDFQPEIHHGGQQLRYRPTEESFLLRGGQEIDVRRAQSFSVAMNVGELVLVTSTTGDEGTLGDRFFCHNDRGMAKQRILVVRVVDSGKPPIN